MKKVYLARHGETNANARTYVPDKAEPLNERGLEQATTLAQRIGHINVDALVTSDFLRARQTVQPIEAMFNLEAVATPLFGEVFEPTSLHSLPEDSELVQEHRKKRNSHVEDPTWRMEDGENMSDVFARVLGARAFLEQHEAEHILVTSHGFFLSLFGAAILLDARAPSAAWFRVGKTLKVSNTGISLLAFDPPGWQVLLWNDHAHFAE